MNPMTVRAVVPASKNHLQSSYENKKHLINHTERAPQLKQGPCDLLTLEKKKQGPLLALVDCCGMSHDGARWLRPRKNHLGTSYERQKLSHQTYQTAPQLKQGPLRGIG
jgi:hypothetical protein